MGKKGGSAPKAPDPIKVAAGQTAANIGTEIAKQGMNINQVTPDGSLTYEKTGSYDYVDPLTNKVYKIPTWTATTSLSDAQKAIKTQSDAAELNLASLANSQSGRLQGLLDRPLELGNEAVEGRLFELGSKRLAPLLEQRRRQAETEAANRGFGTGGAAYDSLMRNVGEQENDAWNQLMLTGRSQALNELLTERNQPLNEISALLSGGAVNQPNFTGTPAPNMQPVDYAGLVQNKYNADMAAYQQKQADKSAALGGMFSALGTAVAMSDRRVKKDVKKVGKTDDGQNIYAYRYKSGGPLRLGLIAQEVEQKKPGAVVTGSDGLKRVDYRKALRLGERASQDERLVPTPRPHPFRDPTRFSYAPGIGPENVSRKLDRLGMLSMLANTQTMFGKPLEIKEAFAPSGHAKNSQHGRGLAFDLRVPTPGDRAALVEAATRMGFTGTGTYGPGKRVVHLDVRTAATGPVLPNGTMQWGDNRGQYAATPDWHRDAVARGLASGEPDMEAIAAKVSEGYPTVRRPRRRSFIEP